MPLKLALNGSLEEETNVDGNDIGHSEESGNSSSDLR